MDGLTDNVKIIYPLRKQSLCVCVCVWWGGGGGGGIYIYKKIKNMGKKATWTELEMESLYEMKQEAHGPRVAHLSIATADMQMLCNIFSNPVIETKEKIILILKKNIIYGMTVNGA